VTIAIRRSWGHGTADDIDLIWVSGEAEYFCKRGWTRKLVICPSDKSHGGGGGLSGVRAPGRKFDPIDAKREHPACRRVFHLLPLGEPRIMLRWLPLDGYMQNEWTKPREYSFTNAAGEVFHEIAYSRQDVNTFANMHKATNYKPTEDSSSSNAPVGRRRSRKRRAPSIGTQVEHFIQRRGN
jgi:hypothetical protein